MMQPRDFSRWGSAAREARTGASLTEATAACEAAIARRFGAGPVDGKIQAHVAMVAR